MIKVSVLITTYNLEKYIEETLNSVICQKTNFEYEILVGDDGSTDTTVDIIKRVRESSSVSIGIYRMPRDNNKKYNPIYRASRNRLNLLKYAKGDFITFLDGDDFYLSDAILQKEFDVLSHNKQYIMCGCDLVLFDESRPLSRRVVGSSIKEGKVSKEKYWRGQWLHAECFLLRNIYKYGNKIAMNHNVFDDNLIVFYFMKYGEMYHISEAMVAYRQNETEWKKKSVVEQSLYSAMDIYEEIRINPKMFFQSLIRHSTEFKTLFDNISQIQSRNYNEERLICRRNNYMILFWMLCYEKIGVRKKILLYIFRSVINAITSLRRIKNAMKL